MILESCGTRRQARACLVVSIAALTFTNLGCGQRELPPKAPRSTPPAPAQFAEATPEHVRTFCTACHSYVPPETFPRDRWREEIDRAYGFYRESNLRLRVPDFTSVVQFFEKRAPETLASISSNSPNEPVPIEFDRSEVYLPGDVQAPAIAHLQVVPAEDDPDQRELLACEMYRGQILRGRLRGPATILEVLTDRLANPCHLETVDLDGDGRRDLLIADLGSFYPTNEKVGSVVWMRKGNNGKYVSTTLLKGVGRVADARAADFDGDGDLDLIVAEFGWLQVGSLLYLENRTTNWNEPLFVPRTIDERHGAIHVPIADLNHDGKPDFVAVLSQEHEVILAFLNLGSGKFASEVIYQGPHAAMGSSGIELVDLDRDGKLDVLYTNGDSLDSMLLRPYHAVHWLRNPGSFPFEDHVLCNLYGAHRALAADFDGDGDSDIVAVSLLPEPRYTVLCQERRPDAAVLLEQTSPGKFSRHVLERSRCDHVTCAVGDVDRDGRVDFVTGNFSTLGRAKADGEVHGSPRSPSAVTIWRNLGLVPASKR